MQAQGVFQETMAHVAPTESLESLEVPGIQVNLVDLGQLDPLENQVPLGLLSLGKLVSLVNLATKDPQVQRVQEDLRVLLVRLVNLENKGLVEQGEALENLAT